MVKGTAAFRPPSPSKTDRLGGISK